MKIKIKAVKTKRLILRQPELSDYAVWFDAQRGGRPAQNKWDFGPRPPKRCTKKRYTQIIKRDREWVKSDRGYWFGVFDKKTGAMIGHFDFSIFQRSNHQFANFGYQIYNRYWGQGYGQEAAAAGLLIGFKQLKLNRLEAAINFDNKKSIRLAKKIGMKREGIKKRYWFENGKWVDHLIYVANPENLGLKPRKPEELGK